MNLLDELINLFMRMLYMYSSCLDPFFVRPAYYPFSSNVPGILITEFDALEISLLATLNIGVDFRSVGFVSWIRKFCISL
jgi:hypothetical protein